MAWGLKESKKKKKESEKVIASPNLHITPPNTA